MSLTLSNTANRLTGQPMFKALSKVKQLERDGRHIIHYEIGDQRNIFYNEILESIKYSIDQGDIYYTESQGFIDLRKEICDYTYKNRGFLPTPDQVVVAPANALINYVMQCVSDPGDNILLPNPGFCTYEAAANYYNLECKFIDYLPYLNFHINTDICLADKIDNKTKLVVINSPCNPTGVVLFENEVLNVYNTAYKNNLYILSDEVYSDIIYNNTFLFPSIYDKCLENTIILNSFSKSFCMSGCRLGYIIAPRHLAEKVALMVETTMSCMPLFTQKGAITALNLPDTVIQLNKDYLKLKMNLLYDGLNSIKNIRCFKPDGAFYMFANIEETGMDGQQFSDFVLDNCGISVLDGAVFGSNGYNHVRLSYGLVSEDDIRESIKLLKEVL